MAKSKLRLAIEKAGKHDRLAVKQHAAANPPVKPRQSRGQ
jgi:hypothetical protein